MTASFFLAVDVGTSRTAAATARMTADGEIVAASFPLGRNSDSTPSVIYVSEGELLFGDTAARRGIATPERLIREFKRRIGDSVPIIAGGEQFRPEQLYARMVGWVIDAVTEREGRAPTRISVAVPATWTGFRTDLVRATLARDGRRDIDVITEPVAAAGHYDSQRSLPAASTLAVYDLGGGTFDAVVVRKERGGGLTVVGEPVGIAGFGGSDFDDAILRHALEATGLDPQTLAAEPAARIALAAFRRECVDAKESLSFDSEAVVPILVGDGTATVRVTRSEFERMIEAGISRTVDVLAGSFDAADVDSAQIDAILLTGGSSRIPRVAQLLSERFDRPIAVDADPKAIVALGAARATAEKHSPAVEAEDAQTSSAGTTTGRGHGLLRPAPAPRKARRKWFGLGAAAAVAAGALMLGAGVAASVGYPLLGDGAPASKPTHQVAPTETAPEPSPTTTEAPAGH